jgi:two-component system chemotaxis response regulator CheB
MNAITAKKRDTLVIGASAGGIEALKQLLPVFDEKHDVSVFIVVHLPANGHSALAELLARSARLKTAFARDGETILPRRVYVAPPDHHLIVRDDRILLWRGPHENHCRPAIDPLFRSAGVARQGRVIGAILSGLLDDGAAGLLSVKRCGGLAFVQAPSDAIEGQMPTRAAEAVGDELDGALPIRALAARIMELIGSPAPDGQAPRDIQLEVDMLLGESFGLQALSERGPPLPLNCPECGGPLWGISDGRLKRFRCHTGHAYGMDSLLSAQETDIEQALWAAIKGLEQRSQVLLNLARDERAQGRVRALDRFTEEAGRLRQHSQTLREVLVGTSSKPR